MDVLVTTAGGVEEDLIKCLAPTYIGDFSLPGKELRQSGINRYGLWEGWWSDQSGEFCVVWERYCPQIISSSYESSLLMLCYERIIRWMSHCGGSTEGSRVVSSLLVFLSHVLLSSRIGNLLVPNDNYCKFEDWLMPILDQMVTEQDTEVRTGVLWKENAQKYCWESTWVLVIFCTASKHIRTLDVRMDRYGVEETVQETGHIGYCSDWKSQNKSISLFVFVFS